MTVFVAHITGSDTATVATALILGLVLGIGLTLRLVHLLQRPKEAPMESRPGSSD